MENDKNKKQLPFINFSKFKSNILYTLKYMLRYFFISSLVALIFVISGIMFEQLANTFNYYLND